MIEQRAVYYAGHVQGVGFRYTVSRIAGAYHVTGYVQNLADGRVLLMAQGEATELEGLMSEIRLELGRHIRVIDVHSQPNLDQFTGFSIRR